METYIIIGNFKEENMASVDAEKKGVLHEIAPKALTAVGGKMLHLWYTLGRFDFFLVVEVPDEAAVAALVNWLPSTIATETIPAHSYLDDNPKFEEYWKKIAAAMKK